LISPKSAELSFKQGNLTSLLVPISDFKQHRQELADLFHRLQAEFPHIQESDDNQFRLTDWTFDVEGVTEGELQQIGDRCRQAGWDFTYSTVQCHLKLAVQSKAAGLKQVLQSCFPDVRPEQVMTVGDSPNDESLFEPALFPLSVGVANVRQYCDRMIHQPTYITPGFEGQGFCELAQLLTMSKRAISREDLKP
jgi:hydroxymethylpyrimidine pyrophosphatase-like HAD family hydrolase